MCDFKSHGYDIEIISRFLANLTKQVLFYSLEVQKVGPRSNKDQEEV